MTREGERLAAYVARVQRLLRAAAPVADVVRSDPLLLKLTEGLAAESRWAMLLAERLMREEDDGR